MLCVLPIFSGDVARAKNLLAWMAELGGCHGHRALITADAGTAYGDVLELRDLAGQSFDTVEITTNPDPIPDYRRGPSSLLKAAATWAKERKAGPWLMCEPDSVPLKQGWLDAIAAADKGHEDRVMGYRYTAHDPQFQECDGKPMMSGVAVYPEDAIDHLVFKDGQAWDVTNREWMADGGHHTPLIKHFYGRKELPPTFVAARKPDDPIHWITLDEMDFLPTEAVLFHRCKDGSLIRELRRKMFGVGLMVVWPFCAKDCVMALKNLTWIAELHNGQRDFDVVLSCDLSTPSPQIKAMRDMAAKAFRSVTLTQYPSPHSPNVWNPTVAFIHAAVWMSTHFGRPWLWMEYDAIPLCRNWLNVLAAEYQRGGKPFAGPIVPGMGHMNGTGIYPADTPRYIPRTMAMTNTAWDMYMKPEMIHHCHNMSRVYFHAWGIHGGKLHPYHGSSPCFPNDALLAQIPKDAVIFHRCKNGSLIDRLREKPIK